MRPLLKPGLRRVRRDGGALQIGLTPGRSLLLNGLDEAASAFLGALDGTRDIAALLAHAGRLGVPGRQAAELLDMLTRAGFLDDAAYDGAPLRGLAAEETARLVPDMASLALGFLIPGGAVRVLGRRRAAVVAVYGCGRVGASVANILAAAGVGCVVPHDGALVRTGDAAPAGWRPPVRTSEPVLSAQTDRHTRGEAASPAEAGTSSERTAADRKTSRREESCKEPRQELPELTRADAVRATIRTTSPSIHTTLPANRQHPDLAVLAPTRRWPQQVVDRLHASGVPHLPAILEETTATLGPFVQPGRTSCLHCRDLHRSARDPGWPRVLAQLVTGPEDENPAGTGACDTVLATHLAVQAAMHALAFIEGDQPPSLNASFDFTLPYGDRERRERPPHPECDCTSDRF